MRSDFHIISKVLPLVMVLVQSADEELFTHLQTAGVEPFFATSLLITWFSHDLKCVDEISRVFDALLCSHPSFCLYLCAAFVIHHRDKILEVECDFASLHSFLVNAPTNLGVPFEEILFCADFLFKRVPPSKLVAMAGAQFGALVKKNE